MPATARCVPLLHVALLISSALPEADADALAHTVLAPLSAEHLRAVVAEEGADRVRRAAVTVVTALLASQG